MKTREEFIKELQEEKLLRETVDKIAQNRIFEQVSEEKKKIIERHKERALLKECVRKIISEAKTPPPAHQSTGINILSELLRKVLPILERNFRKLTTDQFQRKSFRAHIINGCKKSLERAYVESEAPESSEQAQAEVDNAMGDGEGMKQPSAEPEPSMPSENPLNELDMPGDEQKFIDIRPKDKKPTDKKTNIKDKEDFAVDGEDETGKNLAFEVFHQIEKTILESFRLLSNDEDKKIFVEYLLTNLKMYFDLFEDNLQTMPNSK